MQTGLLVVGDGEGTVESKGLGIGLLFGDTLDMPGDMLSWLPALVGLSSEPTDTAVDSVGWGLKSNGFNLRS
jgi:hypothetical protein